MKVLQTTYKCDTCIGVLEIVIEDEDFQCLFNDIMWSGRIAEGLESKVDRAVSSLLVVMANAINNELHVLKLPEGH